jgi:hypothetical protein
MRKKPEYLFGWQSTLESELQAIRRAAEEIDKMSQAPAREMARVLEPVQNLTQEMERTLESVRSLGQGLMQSVACTGFSTYYMSDPLSTSGIRLLGEEGIAFPAWQSTRAIEPNLEAGLLVEVKAKKPYSEKKREIRIKSVETWDMRWVSLLAYILPKRAREEWLGDLQEARCDLIGKGHSQWVIKLITWGRVLLLGWSFLRIKYQDLLSSKSKERQDK